MRKIRPRNVRSQLPKSCNLITTFDVHTLDPKKKRSEEKDLGEKRSEQKIRADLGDYAGQPQTKEQRYGAAANFNAQSRKQKA